MVDIQYWCRVVNYISQCELENHVCQLVEESA